MRASGILLHITSLPSDFGIGDLGPQAYRFTDFLNQAGQRYWQILPITPTSRVMAHSPYSSPSAFAGNSQFISPELLAEDGLLAYSDLAPLGLDPQRADLDLAREHKHNLLAKVFARHGAEVMASRDYMEFELKQASWLDDYALFSVIKNSLGGQAWTDWPDQLKFRQPEALDNFRQDYSPNIRYKKFVQYLFFSQWQRLREYQKDRGLMMIGDAPIYVTHDSADVWANPELFQLDEQGKPTYVAGVPPDYFSQDGQRWGNPVYNWDALQKSEFNWWIARLEHYFTLFDLVRLDHFLAFSEYYRIPVSEKTARNGTWVEAKGWDMFTALARRHLYLPVIAEDLGLITPAVRELKKHFNFPGMAVLQFGFGGNMASNPDVPHNISRHCLVYPGTHDNNTCRGWFEQSASPEEKANFLRYIGGTRPGLEPWWAMIRLGLMSRANTAIIAMQDALGLDSWARMNTPSSNSGNWTWRMRREDMSPDLASRLRDLTSLYGRL